MKRRTFLFLLLLFGAFSFFVYFLIFSIRGGDPSLDRGQNIGKHRCPSIIPCEERTGDNNEENINNKEKEEDDDEDEEEEDDEKLIEQKNKPKFPKFDRELNICVVVLIHKFRREKEVDFTQYLNNVKLNYQFIHAYAKNDDYPKDDRKNFVVFPEFADYHNILEKVWYGLNHFYDKKCDFVGKMDDDVTPNFSVVSAVFIRQHSKSWIGRAASGWRVQLNKGSKWYDISYYEYSNHRKNYWFFMAGQMYFFGKDLYKCVLDEGRRVIKAEKDSKKQKWIKLHNEDTAFGLLAKECEYKDKRYNNAYFGSYIAGFGKMTWRGIYLIHKAIPSREGTDLPLNEVVDQYY